MTHKIFIDGHEGTTGLQIRERLAARPDLTLLEIEAERRKDLARRRELVNEADFVITCLPDAAAKESIGLIESPRTRVLDPSTAHRTAPDFVYGFPELRREQRSAIAEARRVSVPGCHAVGFVAALAPLIAAGIVPREYPSTCFSLTGYSGGGRKMIEEYEDSPADLREALAAPRPYALGLAHKHLPEMQALVGLAHPPCFEPVAGRFRQGMLVSVPLHTRLLRAGSGPREIRQALAEHYAGARFVQVMPLASEQHLENGRLSPLACNGTNRLELFVFGNEQQVLLVARLDNLGKGASGSAVQCLNLMLGVDEGLGL